MTGPSLWSVSWQFALSLAGFIRQCVSLFPFGCPSLLNFLPKRAICPLKITKKQPLCQLGVMWSMALFRWSQIRRKLPLLLVNCEVPVVDITGKAREAEGQFLWELQAQEREAKLTDHSQLIRVGSGGMKEVAQPLSPQPPKACWLIQGEPRQPFPVLSDLW